MNETDDPANSFASRSPGFYRSQRFQNAVDPVLRPSVRAFVKRLIEIVFGRQHQAANEFAYDEVANDTLNRCYRNVDGRKLCRATNPAGRLRIFRKFLYTIARNCVREYVRRERGNREVATDQAVLQALAEQLDGAPLRDTPFPEISPLLPLIAELPPEDQRILYLRFVVGYTWSQVAQALDSVRSESSVKVRGIRLRNRLVRKAHAVHGTAKRKGDDNE